MVYILALFISACLICGQTAWGSTVKKIAPIGSNVGVLELISKMLVSWGFWLGVLFYLVGTGLYFLLLSKVKFFSVQVTMTGLAIIFSVIMAYFVLHEDISLLNVFGITLVLSGIFLVYR